jgi:hypothetical protein
VLITFLCLDIALYRAEKLAVANSLSCIQTFVQ